MRSNVRSSRSSVPEPSRRPRRSRRPGSHDPEGGPDSEQTEGAGDGKGVAASADSQLGVQARDVGLHGVLADDEVGGNVRVRRTAGQLVEDVPLTWAEGRTYQSFGDVGTFARG